MHGTGIFTVFTVIVFVLAAIYRVQALHKKKIWYLSIQQLIYLVLIPGLVFPMIFSYLINLSRQPRVEGAILPDGFLINTVILSLLFGYGGTAIHAVTKMLSEYLRHTSDEVGEINRFFHLTFSHNMILIGVFVTALGITLLELNHLPSETTVSVGWGTFRGLLLGASVGWMMYNYARYTGSSYNGKWSDLKISFGVIWVAITVLLYVVQKLDVGFTDYQLLLPMLLSFSILAGLSIVLVFRRFKRGGMRIWIGKRKLERYLSLEERA